MAKTIDELIVLDAILSSPCEHSKFNKSGYYKIYEPIGTKDLRSIRLGVDFDWAKLSGPGLHGPVQSSAYAVNPDLDPIVVKNFEKSIERIRNLGCQVVPVDMSKASFPINCSNVLIG